MTATDAAGIEAALADVLAAHDYAVNDFGAAAKRDGKYLPSGTVDPGWHGCRCGEWAGYWSDFRAHVAAALLPLVTQAQAEALRAAADDVIADCTNRPGPCICASADWLRARADESGA